MDTMTPRTTARAAPEVSPAARTISMTVSAVDLYMRVLELLDNNKRRDTILSELECPPRTIDDALEYRRLMGIPSFKKDSGDTWQFENLLELHTKKEGLPQKQKVRPHRTAAPDRQTAEKASVQNASPDRIVGKDVQRKEPEPTHVPPEPYVDADASVDVVAATEGEVVSAKGMIDTVMHNAKLEFGVTEAEIQTEDEKDFRARAYRIAVLLVLDHYGVRPEVAAEAIGRSALGAKKLFALGRVEVHDARRPAYYYAQTLANRLGIRFATLKKGLK